MDKTETEKAVMLGQAFAGAMMSAMNLTAALMHGMVIKGYLTKEQARALLDEAALNSANMDIPAVFSDGIRNAYSSLRHGFE